MPGKSNQIASTEPRGFIVQPQIGQRIASRFRLLRRQSSKALQVPRLSIPGPAAASADRNDLRRRAVLCVQPSAGSNVPEKLVSRAPRHDRRGGVGLTSSGAAAGGATADCEIVVCVCVSRMRASASTAQKRATGARRLAAAAPAANPYVSSDVVRIVFHRPNEGQHRHDGDQSA
jgi:hypothetical protein